MTDWDEVVEYIHHAMQAVDEAHSAAEQLRQNTNHANFQAFLEKMAQLQERQRKIQMVLDNEEAFAVDELVDALSLMFTGHRAEYRRTPRMKD
jgi:hypothetical protein